MNQNESVLVKMTITEDQFRDLVLNQRKPDVVIARELGVCSVTVQHWRKRFGLPNAYFNRPKKQAPVTRPRRKLYLDEYQLRDLYETQGISQRDIALKYGVTQATVGNWIWKYNIDAREQGGRVRVVIPRDELRVLYLEKKMTLDEIGSKYGTSDSSIRQNLIRYGLQIDAKEIARRRLARNAERYPQKFGHKGYIQIRKPDHHSADQNGYVPEHRLVAEMAAERPLVDGEQVHHINLRKMDNVPGNLAIIPDRETHHRVHKYLERVAVFLLGLTDIRPEPLDFGQPVFWGGKYITVLDLLQNLRWASPESEAVISRGQMVVKEAVQ